MVKFFAYEILDTNQEITCKLEILSSVENWEGLTFNKLIVYLC